MKKHILMYGVDSTYIRWTHHGENMNVEVNMPQVDVHDSDDGPTHGVSVTDDCNYGVDPWEGILGDLNTAAEQENQDEDADPHDDAEPHEQESFFKISMEEAKRKLYFGSTKFSRFSFVVKLLHMKSLHKICNSAFLSILKLLAEAFPQFNTLKII